ncbi:MAG: hypothetical protein N2053_12260 [Chitinispirillaceae bacterium]|nr:hypothetical protein [Chitinispirillaceae bacterium]
MRIYLRIGYFLVMLLNQLLFSQPYENEDTLTRELCNSNEQIVARRNGEYRIEYYMGETQLNMKTISGFLELNSASKPWYKKYKAQKLSGIGLFLIGVAAIVADGYIKKPSFPVISVGGIGTSAIGLIVYVKANDKFRRAIYEHNKDVCKIKK